MSNFGYPKITSMLDSNKYYTIKDLLQAFTEAGKKVTYKWIINQEKKGNLKLPRSTTNFKKPHGFMSGRQIAAVREMTGGQIQEIIKAFLPGGKGYWHFN